MGDKNEIDIMWFDVVLLQARENTCPAIYKKINIVGFHVKAGIKSSTASKGVTATRHRESDRFHHELQFEKTAGTACFLKTEENDFTVRTVYLSVHQWSCR